MMNMAYAQAFRFVNHVLSQNPWALTRLMAFAGRVASVHVAGITINLAIDRQGYLEFLPAQPTAFGVEPAATSSNPATPSPLSSDVSITLPANRLMEVALRPERITSAVQIQGAADFAETLSTVLRQLRWDVEGDVAEYVGDVAAYRGVKLAKQGIAHAKTTAQAITENVREYLQYESGQLCTKDDIQQFTHAVDELRDDVARFEKRLVQLERGA